jgi:hypothetical protein
VTPALGDTREATCPFCADRTPQVLKHSWAEWAAWECQRCHENAQTNVFLGQARTDPQRP